jgi:hypothetical protein
MTLGLDDDFFAEGEERGMRRFADALAAGLAFLMAVDAVETDMFRAVIVQDFDSVTVENADHLAW